MTNNEEAIAILKKEFSECKDTISVYAKKRKKAFDMAIKALEQEDVLEKIRAEIENHCGLLKENHCRYCSYCNSAMGVREILKVIDKYRKGGAE